MNWRVVWIITSITSVEHSDIACLDFNYSSDVALLLIWVWKACMSYAFIFFRNALGGNSVCRTFYTSTHFTSSSRHKMDLRCVWSIVLFSLVLSFFVATVAFWRFLHLMTGSFAATLCLNLHSNPNFLDSISCIVWCLVLLPHSMTVVSGLSAWSSHVWCPWSAEELDPVPRCHIMAACSSSQMVKCRVTFQCDQ